MKPNLSEAEKANNSMPKNQSIGGMMVRMMILAAEENARKEKADESNRNSQKN